MTYVDWIVAAVYLVGITLLGSRAARRVTSSASYFISDRRAGKILMILFSFSSGTHFGQAATLSAKTCRSGASGIWYQWLWLLVTPFFWLLAPMFRRMRAVTVGDFFEARYGRSVSSLYAVVGIFHAIWGIRISKSRGRNRSPSLG